MMIHKDIVLMGMVCITIIELYALNKGINGVLLTGVVAIIAGAIGVTIPQPRILKK